MEIVQSEFFVFHEKGLRWAKPMFKVLRKSLQHVTNFKFSDPHLPYLGLIEQLEVVNTSTVFEFFAFEVFFDGLLSIL